jgi:hypothetical protein
MIIYSHPSLRSKFYTRLLFQFLSLKSIISFWDSILLTSLTLLTSIIRFHFDINYQIKHLKISFLAFNLELVKGVSYFHRKGNF